MWCFRAAKEKYFAVADEIARLHEIQQPVLGGTTSIEKIELLSQRSWRVRACGTWC